MLNQAMTIEPQDVCHTLIFDCRFSLGSPDAGVALYRQGHIPGAFYLHLEDDLSSPVSAHGGRHPLPDPDAFVALLAAHGVGRNTDVIAYDDSHMAYAARLWWMMKSLGYKQPRLLNGGYQAWLQAGGEIETVTPIGKSTEETNPESSRFTGFCDIEGLRRAQQRGCVLVDSREERRFMGLEEPIDPVAGHIPGAQNHPWQSVTDSAGRILGEQSQREHWGEALSADSLVVYCGSGVTACVNLFSLATLGRGDAILYAGSWSDWCSHL